jgi:hypothetical protein
MALVLYDNRMGLVQYAILNDIHLPYEGVCYYTALELMQKWPNLRGIYLNGDVAEIESVSTHPKSPKAQQTLLDELSFVNQKFDTLQRIFGDLPVEYLSGNHEHRIYRYIRDVAPHLWGMVHAPKLLRMDERKNWHYTDYGPTQLVRVGQTKDLYVRHEPLAGGQLHAKGTAEKALVSIVYGHTHVYQSYTHKKFGPSPIIVTAISNGFLGDINSPCFNYRGSKDNWQNGFMRVDCDEDLGTYECRFIPL